ncbi:hypothetical protein DW741_12570 [Ruminococcaceae bacterium AM28-23LB]|nr:hypothetical protein DW741_12570 [Ruminococcaceae bacterium AM28-23LB]
MGKAPVGKKLPAEGISPPGKVFSKKIKKFQKTPLQMGQRALYYGSVVTVKETAVKALSDKGV